MAVVVYVLCVLTSLLCAGLLLRAYMKTRTKLLFWSAIGFVGLAVENVVLFIDLVLTPASVDLSLYRDSAALIGLLCLLYGFVRDVR